MLTIYVIVGISSVFLTYVRVLRALTRDHLLHVEGCPPLPFGVECSVPMFRREVFFYTFPGQLASCLNLPLFEALPFLTPLLIVPLQRLVRLFWVIGESTKVFPRPHILPTPYAIETCTSKVQGSSSLLPPPFKKVILMVSSHRRDYSRSSLSTSYFPWPVRSEIFPHHFRNPVPLLAGLQSHPSYRNFSGDSRVLLFSRASLFSCSPSLTLDSVLRIQFLILLAELRYRFL